MKYKVIERSKKRTQYQAGQKKLVLPRRRHNCKEKQDPQEQKEKKKIKKREEEEEGRREKNKKGKERKEKVEKGVYTIQSQSQVQLGTQSPISLSSVGRSLRNASSVAGASSKRAIGRGVAVTSIVISEEEGEDDDGNEEKDDEEEEEEDEIGRADEEEEDGIRRTEEEGVDGDGDKCK